ncbi:integrase [Methylorubrum extorquens]
MKAAYVRERVRLTADHVRKAKALVASGKVEGRGIDWADDKCQGLVLRVQRTSATWYLKLRTTTLRIASVDVLDLDAARDQADQARLQVKRGENARAGLASYEANIAFGVPEDIAWLRGIVDAKETPEPLSDAERRLRGPWLWRDLVEEFLAAKSKKLKAGYREQYATYLRHSGFHAIEDRPVSSLTITDLEICRNAIVKANTVSAAHRSVQQGKEALSWAWRYHAGISGLADCQYEWWARWSIDYAPGKRDHVPTIQDLVRTILAAERHRTLGATEHATGDGTLGALWALVLTGQRTGQLTGTRRTRAFPWPDRPGWVAVNWDGGEMKGGKSGGRPHSLPVPPEAWSIIESHRAACETPGEATSAYLFPSIRGDGPVGQSALNQLLYRLEGRAKDPSKEKPGARRKKGSTAGRPREDLMERYGIAPWVPHDVRRALATFLDERRLGGAGSAILAHRAARSEDERERVEHVTRLHYAKGQRLPLKAEGMEAWVATVLAAYETERAALFGGGLALAA